MIACAAVPALLWCAIAAAIADGPAPAGAPSATFSIDSVILKAETQLPLVMSHVPNWKGRELRFHVLNTGFAPVAVCVKVAGLKAATYDCYVSGVFEGTHTREALASGVTVETGAGVLQSRTRKLMLALDTSLAEGIAATRNGDWPLKADLEVAQRWRRTLLYEDAASRTASIVLIESGFAPGTHPPYAKMTPEFLKARTGEFFDYIQRLKKLAAAQVPQKSRLALYNGWFTPIAVEKPAMPDAGVVLTNYSGSPLHAKTFTQSAPGQPRKAATPITAQASGGVAKLAIPAGATTLTLEGTLGQAPFTRTIDLRLPPPADPEKAD